MPRWLAYLIAMIVSVLVALLIAPVFPAPLSTILYWGGWLAALVFLVLAGLDVTRSARPMP